MSRVAIASALLFVLASARAGAGELVVLIHGLASSQGEIQVELYGATERATFPYPERGVTAEVRLKARTLQPPATDASVSFGNLAPGPYAVVVGHDANGNGDIDRNVLGVPTESYGFSNGVRPTIRPPSFDEAAVTVGAAGATVTEITVR